MAQPIKVLICLLIAISTVLAQLEESYFTEQVPAAYFSRSNLSDCHERFHDRPIDTWCHVFGGTRANVTEFPHMAVIGWIEPNGGEARIAWKCGGSLITKRFVVTAAHCAVDEANQAPSVVRFGDVNLASDDDDEYAQQMSIVRFVRHPQHRFSSKYNDIAVIELEEEVNLTIGVCPACVWYDSNLPYDNFDVAGFGATGYAEKGSPQLLKAHLRTENRANCSEEFEATRGLPNGISEEQLCASNIGMDTCQGDSGGPLQMSLYTYNQEIPTLIGVTSFGRSCGFGSVGVYQKIQPHIRWMESIVGESLDPLECAKKYDRYRVGYQLEPECRVASPYVNRVELHWEPEQPGLQCAGTLIDYNTVITSASCTRDSAGNEPQYISILGEKVAISEVKRHPHHTPGSPKDNIALIRLKLFLNKNSQIAPACPSSGTFDYGESSLKISRNISISKDNEQLFLPVAHKCDNTLFSSSNFTGITNTHIDCWSTNYRLIPGLCEIDEGGPFLNYRHTTLQGINVLPGDCGTHNSMAVLKLEPYMEWIEAFVLDRSANPGPPITFPNDDNSSLFFKPCRTREGIDGACLDHFGCGAEIIRQKQNRTGVTMCGFEGDVGYICCPRYSIGAKPLQIPLLPEVPLVELEPLKPIVLEKHKPKHG